MNRLTETGVLTQGHDHRRRGDNLRRVGPRVYARVASRVQCPGGRDTECDFTVGEGGVTVAFGSRNPYTPVVRRVSVASQSQRAVELYLQLRLGIGPVLQVLSRHPDNPVPSEVAELRMTQNPRRVNLSREQTERSH